MKRTLMKLTALCAVCLFTLSAAAGGHPNYLCFTAGEGGATIALNKVGTPTAVTIECQKNGITDSGWTAVDFETATTTGDITLAANDFVYFRNASDEVTGFSTSENDYYKFAMSGSVAASGNVMSLVDADCATTTIPCNYCFYRLFQNCRILTAAPELPAETLAGYCYSNMFDGCQALTAAPELPAETLAGYCYGNMFYGCTKLTTAPELPATQLADYCYHYMFYGCKVLTVAPNLPATTLTEGCYKYMFANCTALTTVPELPAKTMKTGCYQNMFNSCKALTTAPMLPATMLAENCYNRMFYGCANLADINVAFTDWGTDGETTEWVYNVASTGTFTCPEELNTETRGKSNIPEGWTVQAPDYLCFTAGGEGSSTIELKKKYSPTPVTIQYRINDATDWTSVDFETANTTKTITLAVGDKVYFRNASDDVTDFSTNMSNYYQFTMSGSIAASGNVMSLVDKSCTTTTIPCNCCFCNLFSGCSALTTAPELPATTLKTSCYGSLFSGCSELTTAPELPATTLAMNCYGNLFNRCGKLTTAPALPATTLADNCYDGMFRECTSLETAPELPATTLANYCYRYMFYKCTSLTTTPALPATTLASYCYNNMFSGCSELTTAPALPATTLASYCYNSMFRDCTSLETTPALPATTLADYCYGNLFSGCTSLTTAPALPATTLASYCYNSMFRDCTSLETAPELPATTLAKNCYWEMFYGCSKLTMAPELPANTLVESCYNSMFYNCTLLKDIKVAFTAWDENYTSSWVGYVANSGTFTCPSVLSKTYDKSKTPKSSSYQWTVKNTYGLTVSGEWASMCVNLPLTVPEGAVVYYASEVEGSTITLKPIEPGTVMAAKTAVIVKKPAEGTTVSFPVGIAETVEDGTTITSYTDNLFEGTSVDKACEASSVYVLNATTSTADKPMFSNYTGTKLNAHKIWLPKSTTGGAEAIQFRFDDATAITHVPMESSDDALYNLAGQRVSSDYRGIVIQNGKKMWNY